MERCSEPRAAVMTSSQHVYEVRGAEPFVGVHNKAPSVIAVRINNPDRSSLRING